MGRSIYLDYSWLPEKLRAGIAKLENYDPKTGPNDFKLTREDVARLGWEKYQQIIAIIAGHSGVPANGVYPFVIFSPTGETYLMSKETKCKKESCYKIFDKRGTYVQNVYIDSKTKQITKPGTVQSFLASEYCFDLKRQKKVCPIVPKTKGIEKYAYKNTLGFRVFDKTPKRNPSWTMLTSDKEEAITGKIVGDKLHLTLPKWGFPKGDNVDRVLIIDGKIYQFNGQHVIVPASAKNIEYRASDKYGNATQIGLVALRIDKDTLYFMKLPENDSQKQEVYREYVSRLVKLGYNVRLYPKPGYRLLEKLLYLYKDKIFGEPPKKKEDVWIPYLANKGYFKNDFENKGMPYAVRVTNWLSGEDAYFKTTKNRAEIKNVYKEMIAHCVSYTAKQVTPFSKLPSDKRVPTMFLRATHKPQFSKIPADTIFNIFFTSDLAWRKYAFESGGGKNVLILNKKVAELTNSPIKLRGRVSIISVRLPKIWTKEPAGAKRTMSTRLSRIVSPGSKMIVDKYGNTIIFTRKLLPQYAVLYGASYQMGILPNAKSKKSNRLNVDLSGFGLGEIKDLLEVEAHPPISKVGRDKQYEFYAQKEYKSKLLDDIVRQIEVTEQDFGLPPGGAATGIRIVEDEERNASVRIASPTEIEIYRGALATREGFTSIGMHEMLHVIDMKFGISKTPTFREFWRIIHEKYPQFLVWVAEHNLSPREQGGHPWDNPAEFFASLLVSQMHPNLALRLQQSDPKMVSIYISSLNIVKSILNELAAKKKIRADAIIFKKIDKMIEIAGNVKHTAPVKWNYHPTPWKPPKQAGYSLLLKK